MTKQVEREPQIWLITKLELSTNWCQCHSLHLSFMLQNVLKQFHYINLYIFPHICIIPFLSFSETITAPSQEVACSEVTKENAPLSGKC